MALNTVHVLLQHGVVRGQAEFGVHAHVTLETGLRRLARVHDQTMEGGSPAGIHVPTAWPMTGFAAGVDASRSRGRMHSCVDTARKALRDRLMAGRTGCRTHKLGSTDDWCCGHHGASAGARNDEVS